MRLPKNFAFSRKSKVENRKFCFDGQKSSENYTYFPGTKFRENVPEFLEIDGICRKSTVIFEIFDIRRYTPKIDGYFREFSGTFWYKMALKIVEMALKMVENHEYYRQRSTVDFRLSTDCQKCTELFVFRLSTFPVNFPKITQISESLIETHGLTTYNKNARNNY